MKNICPHCRQRLGSRPAGLCRRCYDDLGIRRQYIPEAPSWSSPTMYAPWRGAYPDHRRPGTCEHGQEDGACSECERRQRAGMVIVETREED